MSDISIFKMYLHLLIAHDRLIIWYHLNTLAYLLVDHLSNTQ